MLGPHAIVGLPHLGQGFPPGSSFNFFCSTTTATTLEGIDPTTTDGAWLAFFPGCAFFPFHSLDLHLRSGHCLGIFSASGIQYHPHTSHFHTSIIAFPMSALYSRTTDKALTICLHLRLIGEAAQGLTRVSVPRPGVVLWVSVWVWCGGFLVVAVVCGEGVLLLRGVWWFRSRRAAWL